MTMVHPLKDVSWPLKTQTSKKKNSLPPYFFLHFFNLGVSFSSPCGGITLQDPIQSSFLALGAPLWGYKPAGPCPTRFLNPARQTNLT